MLSTTQFLALAHGIASKHSPDLAQRWTDLSYKFPGAFGTNAHTTILLQEDGRVDVLLRSLEADQAAAIAAGGDIDAMGGLLKMALSRHWVLSTYEIVRTVVQAEADKVPARLLALHDRLKLVRVPLAKSEIANTNRRKGQAPIDLVRIGDPGGEVLRYEAGKTPYSPVRLVSRDTGSLVWGVIDPNKQTHVEITRRELSDELLGLFE